MRPDGSAWDHWLYSAEPQLALDGGSKTRAGVFGAQIEVRIGQEGQPIGVCSRWTPLSGERKFTDLRHFVRRLEMMRLITATNLTIQIQSSNTFSKVRGRRVLPCAILFS